MVRIHFFPAISIHALLAESDDRRRSSAAAFSDFYPRSPCGERRGAGNVLAGYRHFYPRSPCGERPFFRDTFFTNVKFLSTLSLRRATQNRNSHLRRFRDFYPRSPCGERRVQEGQLIGYSDFYPRSPCGERQARVSAMEGFLNFYPRSPCGERRTSPASLFGGTWISIHALLAESDASILCTSVKYE